MVAISASAKPASTSPMARSAMPTAPSRAEPGQVVQHDDVGPAQPLRQRPFQPVADQVLDDADLVQQREDLRIPHA